MLPGFEVGLDFVFVEVALQFVGDEDVDDVGLRVGFGGADGLEAVADGEVVVLAAGALADDDVDAAVAEVLGLGVALRTVADDGDRLAFEGGEVGVFVVVDCGCHGELLCQDSRIRGLQDCKICCTGRPQHLASCQSLDQCYYCSSRLRRICRRPVPSWLLRSMRADHGDAAGAHQLDDAERPHQVDERLDLFFLAGDFDHHFVGGDIDDAAAEDFGQLADFGALARLHLDLDQHQVAFDVVAQLTSSTRTTVTIFSSCLRTCSSTLSSPTTTNVIRESRGSSVSPTARLSMLKPREANMPATWASTPGTFCTVAERTWRMW